MTTNLTNLPVGFAPNYMLCIAWIDSALTMHRYALWKDVGEIVYFDIPLYAGQLVKKNFRLEIWSTNLVSVNQDAAIDLFTSVLGNIDYRYGSDFALVVADPLVTNFSAILPDLPFVFPDGATPQINP